MHSRFARLCGLWFAGLACCAAASADEATEPVGQPAAAVAVAYTAAEQQWLAEHPGITVFGDAGSPPFDFLAISGERQGLFADYLAELARATGLRFSWSEQTRRELMVDAVRGGQAHLLAGFAVPATGTDFLPVRRALAQDYPVLVVRRVDGGFDNSNTGRQRVSLVRGYAAAADYAARTPSRQLINSEGFETALVDVAVGRTDLSIQSLAVAEYLIRERGLVGLRIAGPYVTEPAEQPLYWSVPASSAPLAGILEKAWDSIPPERHRALRARWIDSPKAALLRPVATASSANPGTERALIWLVMGLGLVVALLVCVLVIAARRASQRYRLLDLSHDPATRAAAVGRVLEQSPGLVFEMEQAENGEVVVRYASREARRLFAISLEEDTLPIEAFLRTILPEDQPRVIAAIQQSASERRELEQEYRLLSSGGLRWVKSVIRPLDEPGSKMVWSGITVDISAQKRAEQRAEQTEQRLREIADNVPGVVFQVQRDLAGTYALNFASASLFAVRGVRLEDFNRGGDAFFDSIDEADRQRVRDALEQSAASQQLLEVEYRVRMPDGRMEWLIATAVPNRTRDGLVIWNGYVGNLTRVKTAELQLGTAQRFLRDLTDGVPGFIYQMRREAPDAPYRLGFISAGVSTHGLSAAEALADFSRLYDAVDLEDRARVLAAIDRSYASQSPYRVEYRLRLPSGLTAWMRTQAAPLRAADGAVTWNGMTFNISEEKLREMQARRAEERLSRLTNALPGVVLQLATTPGGDWLYTHISDGARQVFQLEPDAVLRDSNLLHDLLFAEDWRRLEMGLTESTHSGAEVLRECRVRRSDGMLRWVRVLARPQGQDGELFVWNGFAQDITDEKESAAQAEALQRRLREVTENVPCTVFQLQRDFEDELSVRFVSENVYGLIGITREELLEDIKRLVDRVVHDDLTVMFGALDAAHREQRPVFFDFRIRDTAGMLRWVRGSVSTPRVEDGGLVWNGAWLDITDIKELEAELASASQVAHGANRLKSEFLATMSHEIRTPMNAIIGLGQLMQQTPLSGTQQSYLAKINTASHSLLGILNDILDHSKIEAGKMSLERTEFDLNSVLDNLSAVTHLKAIEKNIELRFEVPPGLPMRLMGDPLRLGQVLLNLTSNAIKFSETGTVVVRIAEITRLEQEPELEFEVSDQGIGLTPQQIDGLFQSFAQGDASTTRKYGGTGLGLSIARNLIRLMGGEISVRSAVGEGSVFRFEASFGLAVTEQPRYQLPADLAGAVALVVDDNAESRKAAAGWLQAFGFAVSQAEHGLAALEMLTPQSRYALVVLDWQMPGLNGVETAERIRALPLATQPALLMSTAYVNDDLVRQCEPLGLKDFLAKPFSPSALFQSVLSALGRAEPAHTVGELEWPLAGLQVLVADDNEVNLEIASAILEAAGARVQLARDGEEALTLLAQQACDIALLDLQMPRLDGLEVVRRLRADARFAGLPLVALTAHAMPEYAEACRLAGFDAYLLKPVDRRELFDTLLRLCHRQEGSESPPAAVPEVLLAATAEHAVAPEIFDHAAALQRLGGNQRLLQRLLGRFVGDHADAAQVIVAAVESRDRELAQREAHTLKGVASNLGATLLAASAGKVESALRAGELPPLMLLDQLRIHQQETLRAIQQSESGPEAAMVTEATRETLVQLAVQLQGLLASHDADAKDAFEALQLRLSSTPPPAMLRLRLAVENYEFDSAALALRDLRRDLNLGD